MARFKVVGISFDHMHMGDLLRMVHEHPCAEIAGLFDPDPSRMKTATVDFEHGVFWGCGSAITRGPGAARSRRSPEAAPLV